MSDWRKVVPLDFANKFIKWQWGILPHISFCVCADVRQAEIFSRWSVSCGSCGVHQCGGCDFRQLICIIFSCKAEIESDANTCISIFILYLLKYMKMDRDVN